MFKSAIGQDSHRFEEEKTKPLIIGGVEIEADYSLQGNSDADPVMHAVTNAISGISGVNIIGEFSDKLCNVDGITDSAVYLKESLKTLKDYKIIHISVSIECLKPKISPHIVLMKNRLSELLSIPVESIGITATSGEGLTGFGQGKGIQAFVSISVMSD